MKKNTVRAIGRLLWAIAGFIISLPAFGPPLAGFIALWAMVTLSSGTFITGIAAHQSDPDIHRLIVAATIYCVYWLSATWIVAQFLLRRELSAIPLFLVTVIAVSALVVLKPWHESQEVFTLGPWALLHVAYMATIVWGSTRHSTWRSQQDRQPETGRS
ncbi:MAG: hypothetical protein M3N82_01690 [Pseudomonadota bacterium]|nr:hypothetical protein [Pseudomonadota bacterium]